MAAGKSETGGNIEHQVFFPIDKRSWDIRVKIPTFLAPE
jgi:hypothetical protein